MKRLTSAKQRLLDNATLIAASQLIFSQLRESGAPLYFLSDLADTTSGGTPDRKVGNYYGGRVSWLKSGELKDGFIDGTEEFITEDGLRNSSAKIYPKGTLVVALYGATVGKTGILTIDAASNQAVCAVIPRTKEVTTRYLYWFFRYKRHEFLNSSFGGAQPNISQRVIRETELPLPSIELQEQICEFLDAVESRQNGLKSMNLPNLPSQISGIHPTVTRIDELAARIEEARELRRLAAEETEMLLLSTNDFAFRFKSNWKVAKVRDICEASQYGYTASATTEETGTKFLRITDIQDGHVNWETVPLCECDNPEPYLLKSNDILFAQTGATTGKSFLILNSPRAIFASYLIRIRVRQLVSAKYLYRYFQTPQYWSQIRDEKKGTGQPNVNGTKLGNIQVPIPPLDAQNSIVAYLEDMQSKLDALKRHQAETAAELDALLPAVLERAFRGEL